MNNKINSIKGFQDILPENSFLYKIIEQKLSIMMNGYGISEIRTPLLERQELFNRSIGNQQT